jgi:SAM-dependent methyltransferase
VIGVLQILVGVTVGLAGFLLFLVQPMLGRYILPWFGGSASTWTVCLLFFQGALLAGYFYAFVIAGRLSLRVQTILQLVILAAAVITLPIEPADSWKPVDAAAPIQRILGTLATSVGLPYAVLATTSPLLQRWMSLIDVDLRVIRYFAVSNFGSFLGLLSYPFLFEPLTSSKQQTIGWSYAFGAFALCFGACAVATFLAARYVKTEPPPIYAGGPAAPRSFYAGVLPREVAIWIGWGTGGTVLLLATTNLISEWISVIPFLWVIPLALYLLTFVLVFAGPRYYRREIYLPLFVVLAIGTLFIGKPLSAELLLTQIVLLSLCMFAGCMVCHGELVAKAPAADRLTDFYLAMAFGGFLGGALVTFLAPALLADIWEYHIAILAIVGCATYVEWRRQGALARRIPRPAFYGLAVVFLLVVGGYIAIEIERNKHVVWQARNFYGVVQVTDDPPSKPKERIRILWQSAENQGEQYLDSELRNEASCDFDEDSALGLALRYNATRRKNGPDAPIRVGFIGMGVGVTLGYNKPGDVIRFYELNPAVVEAAHTQFTFIRDAKAKVEIVLGDGRLALERESKIKDFPKFDVLSMDAYRGASPPIHLVTKEAFEIYLSLLKPDGILLIDLDLDNFELSPLHRGMSKHFNLPAAWFDTPSMVQECEGGVSWAIYTRDEGFWNVKRVAMNRSAWPDRGSHTVMWTDQYSNLFSVINSHFVDYIRRALRL